jgi:serine/threonine protein phosphatase PrpC
MLNYNELVSTLVIAVIHGNKLYGANVGDSRVYIQRNNRLTQFYMTILWTKLDMRMF